MVYHQFQEELGSIQGVELATTLKGNNVLICNVRFNKTIVAYFSILDPNDFVDDAIIADVLAKIGMSQLIPLYQAM